MPSWQLPLYEKYEGVFPLSITLSEGLLPVNTFFYPEDEGFFTEFLFFYTIKHPRKQYPSRERIISIGGLS